jgi:hypothetical protein
VVTLCSELESNREMCAIFHKLLTEVGIMGGCLLLLVDLFLFYVWINR